MSCARIEASCPSGLSAGAPDLTTSFSKLNRLFNMLGYNPNGREGPDNAARQEGYLFWLAWTNHAATQLFSTSDAHGTFRPVTIAAPCATLQQVLQAQPALEFTSVLTPLLTDSKACNGGTNGSATFTPNSVFCSWRTLPGQG